MQMKGLNLAHSRTFVETEFGLEGWASVGASLSKESRDVIESAVASGWYPAHLHVELLRAIVDVLGRGDLSILRRVAIHDVEFDVNRIYRVLYRFATPNLLIEKLPEIWTRYFDSGTWSVVRPSPTTTQCSLARFAIVDAHYCAYLGFYFTRQFELAGAKDMRTSHPLCRARGDGVCRFDGQWR